MKVLGFLGFSVSIFLAGILFNQQQTIKDLKKEIRRKDLEDYQIKQLIDWDSKKTKFVLITRDSIIKKYHPEIEEKEAFDIANFILLSSLRRKIDPILLLAMARRESRFDTKAKSNKDARGILQVIPSTARMLCDAMGIEYYDGMLFDYKINIELATKYIDYLRADYSSIEDILIGYNAGPGWIKIYRKKKKIPKETFEYIRAIRDYYREFDKYLASYMPEDIKRIS